MRYEFELNGKTPLLMNYNSVDGRQRIGAWIEENKKISVPGDDRTPPWGWQERLYTSPDLICCPNSNLRKCLIQAGSKEPLGKKGANHARLVASGVFIADVGGSPHLPLFLSGKQVPMKAVLAMRKDPFEVQAEKVAKLGFRLDVNTVKIGTGKNRPSHIRVRPMADMGQWQIKGLFVITDPDITPKAFESILKNAGNRVGLMDWRPGSDSPQSAGPYGQFDATLKRID